MQNSEVPIFKCLKMGLQAPESINGDHFLRQHPPHNGGFNICWYKIYQEAIRF